MMSSLFIAVITVFAISLDGNSFFISESTSAKGEYPLSVDKPSTGIPHVLAMDITPQLDKEVSTVTAISVENQSNLAWLDRAIKNLDNNTRISHTEKELFFAFVENGKNMDVKITDNEGNSEYYRLYFIEVQ